MSATAYTQFRPFTVAEGHALAEHIMNVGAWIIAASDSVVAFHAAFDLPSWNRPSMSVRDAFLLDLPQMFNDIAAEVRVDGARISVRMRNDFCGRS
jgi:hypothetical protein